MLVHMWGSTLQPPTSWDPAPRLSSEAQALNEPENLGMAPAARLVVVDVERASEPGVYKVRQAATSVRSWQGETSSVEGDGLSTKDEGCNV